MVKEFADRCVVLCGVRWAVCSVVESRAVSPNTPNQGEESDDESSASENSAPKTDSSVPNMTLLSKVGVGQLPHFD